MNIENTSDNNCFAYSILAAVYPTDLEKTNPKSYLEYLPTLKFSNIKLPIRPRDIPKFELQNSLRINVFGFDSELKTGTTIFYLCFYLNDSFFNSVKLEISFT